MPPASPSLCQKNKRNPRQTHPEACACAGLPLLMTPFANLEKEFHAHLHSSGAVRIDWAKERISRQARRVSGQIGRSGIASNDVVARIAGVGRVIDPELRMVEGVERFKAELERLGFLMQFHVLRKGHIEV